MARNMFYSFHYEADNWRAAQVRNIGAVSGNRPVSDNEWEQIVRGGDAAIRAWIDHGIEQCTDVCVLIGSHTAERKWIKYEIRKALNERKGLFGIYIHGLKDVQGTQGLKGRNPFDDFPIGGRPLSSIVKVFDPPFKSSNRVYNYIAANLGDWAESSIRLRKELRPRDFVVPRQFREAGLRRRQALRSGQFRRR